MRDQANSRIHLFNREPLFYERKKQQKEEKKVEKIDEPLLREPQLYKSSRQARLNEK